MKPSMVLMLGWMHSSSALAPCSRSNRYLGPASVQLWDWLCHLYFTIVAAQLIVYIWKFWMPESSSLLKYKSHSLYMPASIQKVVTFVQRTASGSFPSRRRSFETIVSFFAVGHQIQDRSQRPQFFGNLKFDSNQWKKLKQKQNP